MSAREYRWAEYGPRRREDADGSEGKAVAPEMKINSADVFEHLLPERKASSPLGQVLTAQPRSSRWLLHVSAYRDFPAINWQLHQPQARLRNASLLSVCPSCAGMQGCLQPDSGL